MHKVHSKFYRLGVLGGAYISVPELIRSPLPLQMTKFLQILHSNAHEKPPSGLNSPFTKPILLQRIAQILRIILSLLRCKLSPNWARYSQISPSKSLFERNFTLIRSILHRRNTPKIRRKFYEILLLIAARECQKSQRNGLKISQMITQVSYFFIFLSFSFFISIYMSVYN